MGLQSRVRARRVTILHLSHREHPGRRYCSVSCRILKALEQKRDCNARKVLEKVCAVSAGSEFDEPWERPLERRGVPQRREDTAQKLSARPSHRGKWGLLSRPAGHRFPRKASRPGRRGRYRDADIGIAVRRTHSAIAATMRVTWSGSWQTSRRYPWGPLGPVGRRGV